MTKQKMTGAQKNLFIIWNPFQRRSESLAAIFDLQTKYYHYDWEERGKFFKLLSYIPKFYLTMHALVKYKPRYVFLQLAPTPLLYAAAMYRMLTGNHYISDCHNTMIYDDHWIKWPFAKSLLRRSYITLIHNEDVRELANRINIPSMILRDPLPVMEVAEDVETVAGISIKKTKYVIIPCGMAADEPVAELFDAARAVPDVLFVMTWFKEGLPADTLSKAPENMCFTGFLSERNFNALFANANAAIVLTTREGTQPSGASEAIALGVPIILSEIRTTKRLYMDAPVFVKNEPESIAAGICIALENGEQLSAKIAGLRENLANDVSAQVDAVKRLMTEGA